MEDFLILEGGLLIISAFLLAITAFTTTRSFVAPNSFRRIFPAVFIFLSLIITWHYIQTTDRIKLVKEEFENGKIIICENKGNMKMGRTVLVEKSRNGWRTDGFFFRSDLYERTFHMSRCVVHIVQKEDLQ
ncbi:MAG: hypothetical protein U9N30_00875 [Campylobacterota bacterium]|nr:hypothetical protein [Campylobacterota bacterium]